MRMTLWFPALALMVSVLGVYAPALLAGLKPAIVPLLGVVMFGMGMTLSARSFAAVIARPGVVALGLALQYLLMPALAWLIGRAFGLSFPLLLGLVLVGSCPGGTASNVICYLAKGDVALSITLTTLSTLLAVIATPWLTWLYMGESVSVPTWAMLLSILKVIIAPVLLGVAVNAWIGPRLNPLVRVFPIISMAAILLIIGIIVSVNQAHLAEVALPVVAAVTAHNLCGLIGGYWLARLVGLDAVTCRTLSLEVGMQNSGLGVALAVKHFSALAALPGVLFSIWHNLSGATLAAIWARRGGVDSP